MCMMINGGGRGPWTKKGIGCEQIMSFSFLLTNTKTLFSRCFIIRREKRQQSHKDGWFTFKQSIETHKTYNFDYIESLSILKKNATHYFGSCTSLKAVNLKAEFRTTLKTYISNHLSYIRNNCNVHTLFEMGLSLSYIVTVDPLLVMFI